jgi:MacB-like periplasmic core domain
MVSLRVTDAVGYNGFSNYLLLSARQFEDLQKAEAFDGVIATDNWDMSATGQDLPEAVHTGKLSANAFEYFGVPPVLGWEFSRADGPYGEEPQHVTVLSYHYWQSHFGGSSSVLGKTLQLDHRNYTIIRVVPPRFAWFHSDVYIPLRLTGDPNRVSMVDARLKPGVAIKAAEASLQPLIQSFSRETPAHFPPHTKLGIAPLNASDEERFRGTLIVLFVAVALMLAVGCACSLCAAA